MADLRRRAVRVPATSANLGAGFDAFGLAVQCHLTVGTVARSDQAERVRVLDGAGTELPSGDDNLVWRSLVAFCAHYDVEVPDVALVSSSDIPLERGLGSSSAAIVAGLALARSMHELPVSDPGLIELAVELEGHPDNVAPALLGGLVACATTDDGALVVRRVNPAPRLRPVVFVPETRQATSAARAVLPETLPSADVAVQAARAGHVLAALAGVWPGSPALAGDRLHEPARLEAMPASAGLLAALRESGVHAWLSGAGPAVVAVVDAVDGEVVARFEQSASGLGFVAEPSHFDLSGALVCVEGHCRLAGSEGCVHCPRARV